MASKFFFIDEDSVSCGICLECYVDKDPRILPCQHTFCFVCLDGLSKKMTKIECPICKRSLMAGKNIINKLPKHILSQCLQTNRLNNDICSKHGKENSLYCISHENLKICCICFDENHSKCRIMSVEKHREIENLTTKIKNDKENDYKLNIDKIEKSKEEHISKLTAEFQALKNNLKSTYDSIINQLNDVKKSGGYDEQLTTLKDIERQIITFNITDLKLNHEIRYKRSAAKNIDQPVSTNEIYPVSTNNDICSILKSSNINYKFLSSSDLKGKRDARTLRLKFGNFLSNNKVIVEFSLLDSNLLPKLRNIMTGTSTIIDAEFSEFKSCIGQFSDLCVGLLSSSKTLESLSFINCSMSENHCKHLMNLLQQINLKKFNFINSRFKPNGIANVLSVINCDLREISLESGNYSTEKWLGIAEIFEKFTRLESVNLNNNTKMSKGFISICNALKRSKNTLRNISVENCNLNMEQLQILLDLKKICPKHIIDVY